MRPTYVDCASAQGIQSNVCILTVQSLVELIGHQCVRFTPEDAAKMGYLFLDAARETGWRDPEEDDGK